MPYIKREDRRRFLEHIDSVMFAGINTPGELNYVITEIIQHYLISDGTSYQKINDVMGALEGAKMEMYRRFAAPYEDTKIKENGDVY